MRIHTSLLSVATVVAALLLPAHSSAQVVSSTIPDKTTTKDGRFVEQEKGWFWYKDPPDPPKKKKPPPPKPGAKPEHPVLSAEWLRDNMDKYRFLAIDSPTKDNMEMYLLLQKLMMDKAEKFAMAHRQYSMFNPGLDETASNPVGGTARNAMELVQNEAMDKTLKKLSKRVGIWYFFRSDCQFCHKMNPAMNMLTNINGMSVVSISLDHKASTDGMIAKWRPDAGQGQMLGVTGTPTIFIVDPDTKKVVNLATGVRTLPDIQRRILEFANQEKWITEKEYELAVRGLQRRFLTEHLDQKALEQDPKKLLAVLRMAASDSAGDKKNSTEKVQYTPWNRRSAVGNNR